MQNLKATIEKDTLVIRIPLQQPQPSRSGKTLVVASSRGNVETDAKVEGKPIIVGVNAYIHRHSNDSAADIIGGAVVSSFLRAGSNPQRDRATAVP
jgi:hypothetical protein